MGRTTWRYRNESEASSAVFARVSFQPRVWLKVRIKQVISVHTEGMHPDLALVHRSTGYTDMILRETGQVVGTEDGLEERWESVFHGE